jgi:tyrosyl-tRNA synthetase
VHEFLYPLAQGYDSVAVEADVELGGTDQTFNLLMARDVQRDYGKRPQVIMTLPILEGLDGVEKMSKSLGNCVGISEEPGEMFGKLMSISDDLMWRYRLLCLGETAEQVESVKRQVASGELHPRDAKDGLAQAIVARYHGVDAAKGASKEFARVFRDRATPEVVDEITLHAQGGSIRAMEMLVQSNLSESKGEAKRLFAQGGVSVNGDRVADPKRAFPIGEYLVKVGPRRFAKVHVK